MRYSPGSLFLDFLFFPIWMQRPKAVNKYGLGQRPQSKSYSQPFERAFIPVDGHDCVINMFEISAVQLHDIQIHFLIS